MMPRLDLGQGTVEIYVVVLVTSFVLAVSLTVYLARWTTGAAWWRVGVVTLVTAAAALPGARLLASWAEPCGRGVRCAADLWSPHGGLAFLGGVGVGALCAWLACGLMRVPLRAMADAATPAVLLALAVGRLGCLAAGCCYGRPSSGPFGIVFDRFDVPAHPVGVSLHPTQLYESVLAAGTALAVLLVLARPDLRRRPGFATVVGLAAYGLGRFAIEFLRADPRGSWHGLSTSQWGSLGLLTAAAVILVAELGRTAASHTSTGPVATGGPKRDG